MSAIKTKIAGGLMVKTEQESGGMVKTEQESGWMVKTEQESGWMVKTEQESGRRGEQSEFQGPVKQKIPDFRLQTNFKHASNTRFKHAFCLVEYCCSMRRGKEAPQVGELEC